MAIYYHLVKQPLEKMATELIRITATPDACDKLLREDEEPVFKRRKLMEKQERLDKANSKLMMFGSTAAGTSSVLELEGDNV